jgi:hypothetical protein
MFEIWLTLLFVVLHAILPLTLDKVLILDECVDVSVMHCPAARDFDALAWRISPGRTCA